MKKKKFEDFENMYELCKLMEEMAGKPKEELGKRQPGETCMYERQRKENENNTNTI